MTLVRQCGTPSCATSAQERTGYMVVMHLSWNTDTPISPLDSKMTHVRQCGTPSCATNAQERTGYSCPQLRTPVPRSTAMSWYPLLRDQRPRAYRLHCAALSCAQRRPEAQPCHGTPSCAISAPRAYRLHCAALSCAQRRPEAQPYHGTPSCATSAQERTGHIMNPNIHAVVPLAARQAPKSVPATLSFCQLPSAAHSRAQKHSHVMVPLAARPAPKSIPATLRCPQLRAAAPRSTAMSWYP